MDGIHLRGSLVHINPRKKKKKTHSIKVTFGTKLRSRSLTHQKPTPKIGLRVEEVDFTGVPAIWKEGD